MKRLGDILIDSGFLSQAELQEALEAQRTAGSKKRLGEIIVEKGLLTELDILRAISSQYELPIIDLQHLRQIPHQEKQHDAHDGQKQRFPGPEPADDPKDDPRRRAQQGKHIRAAAMHCLIPFRIISPPSEPHRSFAPLPVSFVLFPLSS